MGGGTGTGMIDFCIFPTMPTYVYRIKSLPEDDPGAFFEVRQSMSDPALATHPESGEPVERVICAPALLGSASSAAASVPAPKPAVGHRHGPSCGCGH